MEEFNQHERVTVKGVKWDRIGLRWYSDDGRWCYAHPASKEATIYRLAEHDGQL